MQNCYIIRYHEIALKGGNRDFFEKKLVNNIKVCLKENKIKFERIDNLRGRIIVHTEENISIIKTIFGMSSFSKAIKAEANLEKIKEIALSLYTKGSFRISAKRSDKNFKISSQELNGIIGGYIVEKKEAKVNLKNPNVDIGIEILNDKAYLFNETEEGLNGLPIGTAGKVAVILDSEASKVSAYLMLKRGCSIVFVKKKDIEVGILEKYAYGSKIKFDKIIPNDAKALIVNDIEGNAEEYETKKVILRPLTGLTKKDIKNFLEEII